MNFDGEGHAVVTPSEFEKALANIRSAINGLLLHGTPWAFPTHQGHAAFLDEIAENFGIHPRNIVFRGSTHLGFSLQPKADKLWMAFGDPSDIDLGFVDVDYFNVIDRELRRFERGLGNESEILGKPSLSKQCLPLRQGRSSGCYRYQDLPSVAFVAEHNKLLRAVKVETFCGKPRPFSAFIYRDWWSVVSKYEKELDYIRFKISTGDLPHAGDVPIPYAVS